MTTQRGGDIHGGGDTSVGRGVTCQVVTPQRGEMLVGVTHHLGGDKSVGGVTSQREGDTSVGGDISPGGGGNILTGHGG